MAVAVRIGSGSIGQSSISSANVGSMQSFGVRCNETLLRALLRASASSGSISLGFVETDEEGSQPSKLGVEGFDPLRQLYRSSHRTACRDLFDRECGRGEGE